MADKFVLLVCPVCQLSVRVLPGSQAFCPVNHPPNKSWQAVEMLPPNVEKAHL